mmetsp:Transcript_15951/g.36496  ORF Transcript_15951/g.36496 Transcript_15951/m.36496 type:complete len:241 (+) Transcript_15951:217-939(+)
MLECARLARGMERANSANAGVCALGLEDAIEVQHERAGIHVEQEAHALAFELFEVFKHLGGRIVTMHLGKTTYFAIQHVAPPTAVPATDAVLLVATERHVSSNDANRRVAVPFTVNVRKRAFEVVAPRVPAPSRANEAVHALFVANFVIAAIGHFEPVLAQPEQTVLVGGAERERSVASRTMYHCRSPCRRQRVVLEGGEQPRLHAWQVGEEGFRLHNVAQGFRRDGLEAYETEQLAQHL